MWTKETIAEQLRKGIMDIQFVKKDGSLREMRCTLNEKYLPEMTKSESTKKENPDVLAVWDIDSNGWRSFIVKQIVFVGEVND
jgi:hypothetical protein